MVRFDFPPYAEDYGALCTSVSKRASRLKKCGKKLRAPENFENRVEGERPLLANTMEDTCYRFRLSQEIRKMSDTKH